MALKKKEKIDPKIRMAEIPLSKIQVNSSGLRLEEDQELINSIKKCGLLNPLTINERYELIAGGRRYFALKALGHETVPVVVYRSTDRSEGAENLSEELVQIDENLVRKNFDDVGTERLLVRRKKIYEALYPQTKRGTAGAVAANKRRSKVDANDKSSVVKDSFVKDTAKKTGQSERTIERSLRRGEAASSKVQEAREQLQLGASHVDELVRLSPEDQDQLLPLAKGKSVGEVKRLVATARESGLGMAIEEVSEPAHLEKLKSDLFSSCKKLNKFLDQILKEQITFRCSFGPTVVVRFEEIKSKIDQFIQLQNKYDGAMPPEECRIEGGR
ncbi:MAG: ParB N-terminal domain-containing protein [Calothrix sp. SM1_5_4]|nr:ParB N-terminal domain-containing protein [Calothrix sp. SM1_5_4]